MSMERKQIAILSADVKGYSRLMGDDEVATIRTLTAYREVMASLIQQHGGRVVDMPGDNLLAEFASVVDAVQCAVEIQQALKAVLSAKSPLPLTLCAPSAIVDANLCVYGMEVLGSFIGKVSTACDAVGRTQGELIYVSAHGASGPAV